MEKFFRISYISLCVTCAAIVGFFTWGIDLQSNINIPNVPMWINSFINSFAFWFNKAVFAFCGWAIVVAIFLLLYDRIEALFYRACNSFKENNRPMCSACGASIQFGANSCSECGASIEEQSCSLI